MSTRATQVLDIQIAYAFRLKSSIAKQFANLFVAEQLLGTIDKDFAAGILLDLWNREAHGTPFFVTTDMCKLAEMAMEDVPREGLRAEEVITSDGFMLFETPLQMFGLYKGKNDFICREAALIKAIAWVQCPVYDSVSNPSGIGVHYTLLVIPKKNSFNWGEGEMVDPSAPLMPFDASSWAFERPWTLCTTGVLEDLRQGEVGEIVDHSRRLLLSLWLLLNQKIVVCSEEGGTRAASRRAERMALPTKVNVIRLRTIEHPGCNLPEGEGPWWTHRWLVRGHWAKRRCGKDNSEIRTVYIAPYVKGPEGLPLIISKKVYCLER